MQVDYETTLGTTVLENIVIRNGEEHSHNKVSYNCLESLTQADHNLKRSQYSHVFSTLLTCFSYGKFEKTLVTCNVWPGLSMFSFLTKEPKTKKIIIIKKISMQLSLI